jgi:hypothetical protein
MKKTAKRKGVLLLAAVLMLMNSTVCCAEDNVFRELFIDSFYGALSGALIGGAIMAFKNKPLDHLDYVGYGAASGVLVGAAFGTVRVGRSFAQVDHGKVKFAVPTIMPDFIGGTSTKQSSIMVTADLLSGKF